MWDLPRPGIEPVSPAPAGEFFTTEPSGKPNLSLFNIPFSPGSCFQSQPLCCLGMDHHCRRGSCYCDEFCHVVPDCCPDHYALCKLRNAHAVSFPSPGELEAVTDKASPLPVFQAKARLWTGWFLRSLTFPRSWHFVHFISKGSTHSSQLSLPTVPRYLLLFPEPLFRVPQGEVQLLVVGEQGGEIRVAGLPLMVLASPAG